jgi:hypothetical protein
MATRLMLLAASAAALLLAGCATATPADTQASQAASARAEELLNGFAGVIQAQDASRLAPLLAPNLRPKQQRELENRAGAGFWLERHRGYALDAPAAGARVSWRDWQHGQVHLSVNASNYYGDRFTDQFDLTRVDGQWYICDFTIRQPAADDPVLPPDGVKHQIVTQAASILARLRAGEMAPLLYDLPDDPGSRQRRTVQGRWDRLIHGAVPPSFPVFSDLEQFQQLFIADWPDPAQEVSFHFAPPNGITAAYELPYTWPAAGIRETDTLRLGLTFLYTGEGWAWYRIQMVAKAFPYSQ